MAEEIRMPKCTIRLKYIHLDGEYKPAKKNESKKDDTVLRCSNVLAF